MRKLIFMFSAVLGLVVEAAEPIWVMAEKDEINSSYVFTTEFDWDGQSPLKLRFSGCSIFKIFVNGEFAAYGPARGPHGWFRMDEWDIAKVVAEKGGVTGGIGCGVDPLRLPLAAASVPRTAGRLQPEGTCVGQR